MKIPVPQPYIINPIRRLLTVLFLLLALITSASAQPVTTPHNVLLLIADDFGIDNLSLYNTNPAASIPATPNITALGQSGVVFTHFYARPSCSQSRACVFTGRDSFRTGVGVALPLGPALGTNEYTLPRAFATNAPQYNLATIGKWHLDPNPNSPLTTGGWTNAAVFLGPQVNNYTNWTKVVNGVSTISTNYTTTDQVNDAVTWIQSRGQNPWFLWLAFNAPHLPRHKPPVNLLTTPRYLNLSGAATDINTNGRAYYEAMIQALDTEIGRLLTVVNLTNTDIILIGDNGTEVDVQQEPFKDPSVTETTTGNGHAKFTIFEGGARTPLIVAGPDVASPGRYNDSLINEPDLFSTIQELAGINVAATLPSNVVIDSVSLLPALRADVIRPTPYVIEEQFNQGADGVTLRNDRYKLIHFYSHVERFYDLANDPYEFTNLLTAPLSDLAQANFYALKLALGKYQTFANTDKTRNLVPFLRVGSVGYTNGTFSLNAQYTQLSTNVITTNPNQPGLTRLSLGGTNLNYQVILWRSPVVNNPLAWTPVTTNVVSGITNNFLLSTNGWLTDGAAAADHYFYQVTPYIP